MKVFPYRWYIRGLGSDKAACYHPCWSDPAADLVPLDWVTKTAFAQGVVSSGLSPLEDLDFADDLAPLSHSTGYRTRGTRRGLWVEQDVKMGLMINVAKIKLMRIGTKREVSVFIAGERIEEVDDFTYLGSIVSKKGGNYMDSYSLRVIKPKLLPTLHSKQQNLKVHDMDSIKPFVFFFLYQGFNWFCNYPPDLYQATRAS